MHLCFCFHVSQEDVLLADADTRFAVTSDDAATSFSCMLRRNAAFDSLEIVTPSGLFNLPFSHLLGKKLMCLTGFAVRHDTSRSPKVLAEKGRKTSR